MGVALDQPEVAFAAVQLGLTLRGVETALDLEEGVFTWTDPAKIALSLKRAADNSSRRKAPSFRSAMSMLVFYINRAGRNLDEDRLRVLEQAKEELRALYEKNR